MKHTFGLIAAVVLAVAMGLSTDRAAVAQSRADVRLAATSHPPLPAQLSQYWLVPDAAAARTGAGRGDDSVARLARGIRLIEDGSAEAGLPLVTGASMTGTPLESYAHYYRALALISLKRLAEADALLTALLETKPQGYLSEAAVLRLAAVAIERQDAERAEDLLEDLSDEKLFQPEEVLMRLGAAEEAVGHRDHALSAYRRLYYEFPLSSAANEAQTGLERLQTPANLPPDRFARELRRAEQLFTARRWAQARAAFSSLSRVAHGDDRELVALRIAEADYYLDRHRDARTALQPYLDGARREAEARFFHLSAIGESGDRDTFITLTRRLAADHPDSEWAAEALNNLATYYIRIDEDDKADAVLRDLLRLFPKHRHGERAAWKVGWRAYRAGTFGEAATIFESAAAAFPRADNRPAWLYWSGRARDQLGDRVTAHERYRLAVSDYQNTYYGRLSSKILGARGESAVPDNVSVAPAASPLVATDPLVRALVAAQLYDQALVEVQYAQRVWGDSPQLLATTAWIRHQQGLTLRAQERFNALRGAINTMRRAYPQFMAAGGEDLPPDILRIIFPMAYWDLITKYSKLHDLDPYLVAALMAQESTFTAEIRSAANAYGLMQIIPGTGRQIARALGVRRFTTSMLTQPETNVRFGTKYFKDMVDQFGGEHYALAGYNAGPHRVVRWLKDAPGLPQDEFIDNIPYAETQTYVKRILGTAEDYRRLYGSGLLDPGAGLTAPAAPAKAAAPAAPARRPAARTPARTTPRRRR